METIKCSIKNIKENIRNIRWVGNSVYYMLPGTYSALHIVLDHQILSVHDAVDAILSHENKRMIKKVLEYSTFSYCIEAGEELIDFKRYKPYIYAKS